MMKRYFMVIDELAWMNAGIADFMMRRFPRLYHALLANGDLLVSQPVLKLFQRKFPGAVTGFLISEETYQESIRQNIANARVRELQGG